MLWQAWKRLDGEDRIKLLIVVLVKAVIFPLQVLFFLLRSAWTDAGEIGWWLRAKHICVHGIDRVRQPCDVCNAVDEERMQQEFEKHLAQEHGIHKN